MHHFTWQHFLDSIREGKATVEESGDLWDVYDDKEQGTMLSFPKYGCSTKEEALRQAELLTVRQMNARRERAKLNERLKCPFCYYEDKISLIDRWSDSEDYYCTEGHHFSITLKDVRYKN